MAMLHIHNVTGSPLPLGDFYTTVPAHGCIRVQRPVAYLPRLPSVRRAMAANQVAIGVVLAKGETVPESGNPFVTQQ